MKLHRRKNAESDDKYEAINFYLLPINIFTIDLSGCRLDFLAVPSLEICVRCKVFDFQIDLRMAIGNAQHDSTQNDFKQNETLGNANDV